MSMQPGNGRAEADIWVRCEATNQDNLEELGYEEVKKEDQHVFHHHFVKEEPGHEEGKEGDHHDIKKEGHQISDLPNHGIICIGGMAQEREM